MSIPIISLVDILIPITPPGLINLSPASQGLTTAEPPSAEASSNLPSTLAVSVVGLLQSSSGYSANQFSELPLPTNDASLSPSDSIYPAQPCGANPLDILV
jgi:hypothetical protein